MAFLKEVYNMNFREYFNYPATAGLEFLITEQVQKDFKPFNLEFSKDNLNSLIMTRKSENLYAQDLLVAFGIDEIGFILEKKLTTNTFSFLCFNDLDPGVLLNQRIVIFNRKKQLVRGIISSNNKYLEDIDCKIASISNLYIEILGSETVEIGDLAVFDNNYCETEDYYIAKALKQRIFIKLVYDLCKDINLFHLNYNLHFGLIAASNIGYRGSQTIAYKLKPQLCLTLTGFETNKSNISKGNGIICGCYDKLMLPNRNLLLDFVDKTKCMKYFGQTSQDGSFIHKTLSGCPCLSVGLPITNIASANEIILKNDYYQLLLGIKEYLKHLNSIDFLEFLQYE